MQFEFLFRRPARSTVAGDFLVVGARPIQLVFVRNPRARRYVLRLRPDGVARVTVPRGGSQTEALRFAERNRSWLAQQVEKLANRPKGRREWPIGTEILLRGEPVKIEADTNGRSGTVRLGSETIRVPATQGDLRRLIEHYLRNLAAKEFPARVFALAAPHQLPVKRVTVRNQRTRWGSCSRRGTISLNWRLIQAPPFVRDYLIFHELAHLREMNHSRRFWREVETLCPDYLTAEKWLKEQSALLH